MTQEVIDERKDVIETTNDVDYAILKSINYVNTLNIKDVEKEIREIANILQIRVIIVEKYVYRLTKNGSIKFDEHLVLTQKGEDEISKFERDSKEWISIDSFIIANMKNRKEKDLKTRKIIDKTLLAIIVILVILVIYVALTY